MSSAPASSGRAVRSSADARAFETRPWGGFETIHEGPGYKVKRLVVEPGRRLSLQRHRFRAESWIVVTGSPRVIVSGRARRVRSREMVTVPKGAWHRIENRGRGPAVIIEVQHGPYLGEDDIIRRQDDYGRTGRDGSASSAGPARPRSPHPDALAPSARSRPKRAPGARGR
jgi:mannose-6-phosphate isomerase-like protein (cupin superfamily)